MTHIITITCKAPGVHLTWEERGGPDLAAVLLQHWIDTGLIQFYSLTVKVL